MEKVLYVQHGGYQEAFSNRTATRNSEAPESYCVKPRNMNFIQRNIYSQD